MASRREWTPSFFKMFFTCVSTGSGESTRSTAMSAVEAAVASRSSTCHSRGVSSDTVGRRPGPMAGALRSSSMTRMLRRRETAASPASTPLTARGSASSSMSLRREPRAPARRARIALLSSSEADRTITRVSGASRAMRSANSRPSPSSSIASTRATCGVRSSTSASASVAEAVSEISSKSGFARTFSSARLTRGSAAAIRMRAGPDRVTGDKATFPGVRQGVLVASSHMTSPGAIELANPIAQGKVRDIYAAGDRLLMVATDRISTYDVVHPTPVPDKGKVLTGISAFWFEKTADIVPNHVVSFSDVPDEVRGRAMLVERLEMFPVECVVRGYITGSGWKDYQASGAICGIGLPDGLQESEQLPEPIFTPATKAEVGDHDENVDFDRAAEILGDRELLERLRDLSIAVYSRAAEHARSRGIILADTKFEFGRGKNGDIVLGDEVLTPDSSRFWPADGYEPGHGQPSFDKQYVRDWATQSGWDKSPPAPALPDDVIARTRELYLEAYERITGEPFSAWLERVSAA